MTLPVPNEAWTILIHGLMGASLAACCGLRAFLPIFLAALAARFGWIDVRDGFQWMSSDTALVVSGVAVVLEILADKIPAIDHALDVVGFVVKPVAGAVAVAAPLVEIDPVYAAIVALVVGGGAAGGVHLTKAHGRVASTATTFGCLNPIVSLVEDVLCLVGVILAILAPLIALAGVAMIVAGAVGLVRWARSRREAAAAA